MTEIRQNKATRQWIIFAPSRSKRPEDFSRKGDGGAQADRLPELDAACPFCPGNESMLPGIKLELSEPGSDSWRTRVVPNKFPALTNDGGTQRHSEGIYLAMPGYGQHEVIIESPLHNQDIAEMSDDEMGTIIETYHRRYVDLMNIPGHMMAIVFRNHGVRAGTSLVHPHSQIVATGIVPHRIRRREERAQSYFDEWGKCVYCEILAYESQDQQRVIQENDSFLSFVPYAAEVPFEIWIAPKRHQADFGDITDLEKKHLARATRDALARLSSRLDDPDYNYIINTAARYRAAEPHLHWYLQIRPRLTTPAGFEIATGMAVNPNLPEEDASLLRSSLASASSSHSPGSD